MKQQKIYLGQLKNSPEYWIIFTSSVQYNYTLDSPMFKYENHIMVKRQVNREEAEFILSVIQRNGNGGLCAGPCESLVELK